MCSAIEAHLKLSIASPLQIQHGAFVLLRGGCVRILLGCLGPQLSHQCCLSLIGLPKLVQTPQLSNLMQMGRCQQLLKAPELHS